MNNNFKKKAAALAVATTMATSIGLNLEDVSASEKKSSGLIPEENELEFSYTSEEFEGRMTGAAGYEKAANFAAENFKAWGLEPLNGSYFQDFSISYSMPVKTSPVINIYVDGTLWKSTANGDYIDDEFVKDIMSAHGTNTGTARGKVTFLGYGIDATADNENTTISIRRQFIATPSTNTSGLRGIKTQILRKTPLMKTSSISLTAS